MRPVFARLIVRDTAGRQNSTGVISADTTGEPSSLALFDEK